MPKIVIKRNNNKIKLLETKKKVAITSAKRNVTIRSASKRGLPGPEGDAGPQGPQGNQGPQGLPGIDGTDGGSFTQAFNGDVVTVTHNLGYIPSLTMYDTAGDEIEGAIIERDNNHFKVQFSTVVSGVAYCS